MNQNSLSLLVSFVVLVLLQVLIFNKMHLFGFINPMVYLLFLVIYPFKGNQTLFILLGFSIGFSIDFLSQSGGAHTLSALTVAYLRPFLIRNAFGVTAEIPTHFQSDNRTLNKLIFLALLLGVHHLIYFSLVFFSWSAVFLIVKYSLFTFLFSLLLVALTSRFYKRLNDS
ncbi:MAG: rod shape-determining protein MreD [Flavobacteriaceae bacterium]